MYKIRLSTSDIEITITVSMNVWDKYARVNVLNTHKTLKILFIVQKVNNYSVYSGLYDFFRRADAENVRKIALIIRVAMIIGCDE